jgi:hypothetical protein
MASPLARVGDTLWSLSVCSPKSLKIYSPMPHTAIGSRVLSGTSVGSYIKGILLKVFVIAPSYVPDEFNANGTVHYIQTFYLYINQFYPQVNALLFAARAESISVTWRDHRPAAGGTDSGLRTS